jgi:hypothetical protein
MNRWLGKPYLPIVFRLTIVGVAPPEFFGTQPGEENDMWVTLSMFPRLVQALNFTGPAQNGSTAEAAADAYWRQPSTWWLVVMARIKPGANEMQARAEIEAIFDQSIDAMIVSEKQKENRPAMRLVEGQKGLDYLRRQFSNHCMF